MNLYSLEVRAAMMQSNVIFKPQSIPFPSTKIERETFEYVMIELFDPFNFPKILKGFNNIKYTLYSY